MKLDELKLIIWDLDGTLWSGVLSDDNAELAEENVGLLQDLADAGVMSSICSKNDYEQVQRFLNDAGVWDLFVFPSINWSPKGARVRQIIAEMGLRQANVLFIDDDATNRAEVMNECPDITVSDEAIVGHLVDYFRVIEKTDKDHLRLNQYRVLERKMGFKAIVGSNEEFLAKSQVQVELHHDCSAHLGRIAELVGRSNQLNFTKLRSTENELAELFNDSNVEVGYATVKDNFGDYGLVGFWAVRDGLLIHFVFSCRVLGMGVEQWVYAAIGQPKLDVVGEVASNPERPFPYWVNSGATAGNTEVVRSEVGHKLLLKGPCDMYTMYTYIKEDDSIQSEFSYVGRDGVLIEGRNHTVHIVQSITLDEESKKRIIDELPFGDEMMFTTSLFDDDVEFAFYSLFTDPNLGLYREKSGHGIVAFGEWTNDLTDESIWDDLINKRRFVANCEFDEDHLRAIKNGYEFLGRISPEGVVENLGFIRNHMCDDAVLILNLGSEIPHLANTQPAYADRHEYNRELNALVRAWAVKQSNVELLDMNEFITGQECFTNNINHFTKRVYYIAAQRLLAIINERGARTYSGNSMLKREVLRAIRYTKRKLYSLIG